MLINPNYLANILFHKLQMFDEGRKIESLTIKEIQELAYNINQEIEHDNKKGDDEPPF
jgi:hypothetical protein